MTTPPRQPPKSAPVAAPGTKPVNAPPAAKPVAAAPTTAKPAAAPVPPKPTEAPQAQTDSAATGGESTRAKLEADWDEQAVINSIMRGDHFAPNLQGKYNNLTYSWRLFCMPDEDFLYEGGVPTDIKEFYPRLDKYKQITIAQTGVTGYNITDVEMTSVISDATARGSIFTDITMKIEEPNGVSFLDSLSDAAKEAGIFNYIDFFYYLELTFKGYDANTGEIVLNPFEELPNAGRWIWHVKINDIDVNLGSGGGSYKLTMLPVPDQAMDAEFANVPDTMIVRGETVGAFLAQLETSINKAWNRRLVIPEGREGFVTHKFEVHGAKGTGQPFGKMGDYHENLRAAQKANPLTKVKDAEDAEARAEEIIGANEEDVAKFEKAQIRSIGFTRDQVTSMKLRPQETDWNTIRTHQSFAIVDPNKASLNDEPKNKEGTDRAQSEVAPEEVIDVPTASVPRGTPIPLIITTLMSMAEDAQHLARDIHTDKDAVDETDFQVNSKGFRECVTWQVIPEVRFDKTGDKKYDFYTNRYGRTIVWHIYPRIDQEPILSQKQIKEAFDPEKGKGVQEGTLAALAARGFLPKRYDYLFTGLNTEVLNFDLNFNFAWQVMLPRFENYYSDQSLQHTRVNPMVLLDQIDANFDASLGETRGLIAELDESEKDGTRDEAKRKDIDNRLAKLTQVVGARNKAYELAQKERGEAEARASVIYGPDVTKDRSTEQNYDRDFIEGILRRRREEKGEGIKNARLPLVPISFSGGDEAKQEIGFGGTGQYHKGRQLFGSILNQTYGVTTGKFQQVEMTVRGDPFWIGYGSYEQAIQNYHDLTVDPTAMSYPTIGNQCFLFRFKYPANIDDSGSIVLKDNETVTGIYKVNSVKNSFSGGQFSQTLSAIRMPLIDLFVSIYGLKPTEEEGDQQKPDQDKLDPNMSPEERKRAELLKNIGTVGGQDVGSLDGEAEDAPEEGTPE